MINSQYKLDITQGSRRIAAELSEKENEVSRSVIMRLMKEIGIQGVVPKKNLSMPKTEDQKFEYLLRELQINKVNQVWSTDITYINTPYGHVYLSAIIDVHSRYIVAWRLSNSLSKAFCIDTLEEALKVGKPEILNTDQGSQYTSKEYSSKVLDLGINLSMDGKGRCLDNVWIERFWRTIKYSEIFLNEYQNLRELYTGIKRYINFYNNDRGHSSLDYETPAKVYFGAQKIA